MVLCLAEYPRVVGMVLLGLPCSVDALWAYHYAVRGRDKPGIPFRWVTSPHGEGIREEDLWDDFGHDRCCCGHAGCFHCSLRCCFCNWNQVFQLPTAMITRKPIFLGLLLYNTSHTGEQSQRWCEKGFNLVSTAGM